MKWLAPIFARYGMLLVLMLLAAVFSVATIQSRPPLSDAAARELVQGIPSGESVAFAVGKGAQEEAFLQVLKAEASARALSVAGIAREPKEALPLLSNAGLRVLASPSASAWLVFEGKPVLTPKAERWPTFLKRDNLINIANQIAVIAIIAIGMTLVVIAGSIDLSVGSLLALSAVTACWCIRSYAGGVNASALGMCLACLAAMSFTGIVGALNGWFITRFKLPPFIVTLATMMIASGAAYRLADHQTIYEVPESFVWLGRGEWLGLPVAVLMMLALYVIARWLMANTAWARHVYAVGGNHEAAVISGIDVPRVLIMAHAAAGLLAGLGGVVMASNLRGASGNYGLSYELYVIAAVVVGGTSLSGGRGKIMGTLVGALIIAVIQNGMNLLGLPDDTQKMVLGAVILGAVMLDRRG